MKNNFEEFNSLLEMLSCVEKLSVRDKLIMAHAFELGFRKGVETVAQIKENE